MKHPCQNCITFAICKLQMQPYLKKDNRRETTLGYLQTVGKKCTLISAYVKSSLKEDDRFLTRVNKIMKEIFNESTM